MEIYQIVLIVLAAAVLAVTLFLAIAGYAFFVGIFKRKPFSLLGEKKHETEQRKFVKEERRKAIEFLDTLACERVEIKAADGVILRGRLYPATSGENRPKRLALCVHGFTSNGRREFGAYVPYIHSQGIDALLVDDRAHGDSDGKYTGFSALEREDVNRWIREFRPRYEKLYLLGISMGAATAAMSAADMGDDVDGLVFDCGFTCPEDCFKSFLRKVSPRLSGRGIFFFGDMWCRLILGFSFKKVSALDAIRRVKCPVLFVQGDQDPTVPKEMSDLMYSACGSENKVQAVFPGAEHVCSFYVDRPRYEKLLDDFFEKTEN